MRGSAGITVAAHRLLHTHAELACPVPQRSASQVLHDGQLAQDLVAVHLAEPFVDAIPGGQLRDVVQDGAARGRAV